MKEFRCSCIGCGRKPEFGSTGIWVQTEAGMLCDHCWKEKVREGGTVVQAGPVEGEFCCSCALCRRTPPDPVYRMWIETESGCICEKCWQEVIGGLLAARIDAARLERSQSAKTEAVDVQLGCCVLNKKLLYKVLDALPSGGVAEVIAENTESMHALVEKHAAAKGCNVSGIKETGETCLVTITRP